MPLSPDLDDLLAQYELYAPEIGLRLRTSAEIQLLVLRRGQLAAWEAGALTAVHSATQTGPYETVVKALRLSEALQAALLRREAGGRSDYTWNWDYSERVEALRLDGRHLEVAYANRRGRYQLRLAMPALAGAPAVAAQTWLAQPAVLDAIAQLQPLLPETLTRLQLVPAWEACQISASAKSREALETGLHFICRALVTHPAYLLVLRGLDGEDAIRRCVSAEIERREAEVAAAVAALPADPDLFWAAPALPDVPAPHEVAAGAGLGATLPPADFWARSEDNALLADALAKAYKNIPRKLAKLTEPRRHY